MNNNNLLYKLLFTFSFLTYNCESKENNTLLEFTYFSNSDCYFKIKYENYKINCNTLETIDKCCNNEANYLYPNISKYQYNSKDICFEYNSQYLTYNCEKLPLDNNIIDVFFYMIISVSIGLFFIINICCCSYYCKCCFVGRRQYYRL